jgi:plastocyanin
MGERSPDPEAGRDAGTGPGPEPRPGMPRWVKVVGVVVGLLVLALVVIMLATGEHGPGRHLPGGNPGPDLGPGSAPIEGAPELPVTAGELRFDPDRIELPAGMPVNVVLSSTDTLHDLVVDEVDFHLAADRDETAVGGLRFEEPGTYVGYCSVLGHREAGMEFEFVVTASEGGHTPPFEHR